MLFYWTFYSSKIPEKHIKVATEKNIKLHNCLNIY